MAAGSESLPSGFSQGPVASSWLYGARVDLLLGCGLGYVLTVPLLIYLADATGTSRWPIGLIGLFTIAINAPHYGATLLRVYEQREDRRKYAFFAVYVTALLFAAFVAALHSPLLGSILITLYVSWSPWHLSGQNYGLALMFLRRRGVDVSPRAKRLFYASFLLSFALALLAMHVEASTAVYAPGAQSVAEGYRVLRLGIPASAATGLFVLVGAMYLLSIGGAALLLLRTTTLRGIAPAGVLVFTQALWYTVPAAILLSRDAPLHALPFAAIWIATAHSAQYLWVTSYYARRTGRASHTIPFLIKALLAGSAIVVLPGLVFMPGFLGTVSWSAGLAILVFSVVNLHHFLLDGAIWKLRDGRVARVLLRAENADAAEGEALGLSSRVPWIRPLAWSIGVVCLVVPIITTWELSAGSRAGDVERLELATRRLAWIGRDSPELLTRLGTARENAGLVDAAIEAHREAHRLNPQHVQAMNNLAWTLAVYEGSDLASAEEAVRLAEKASQIERNQNAAVLDTLAVAQAARGRFVAAELIATTALSIARAKGRTTLSLEIEERLELYRAGEPFSRTRSP